MFIDYFTHYQQIQSLMSESQAQLRGYRFEQLIREILPWSHRPPIALTGSSEQHDAYFTWEGRDYLVEAKAKGGRILRGSRDWEDFELKIRKRHGQACGIFASLYEVAPEIFKAANDLSLQGMYVVVIDREVWKMLLEGNIGLDKYISYVIMCLKIRNVFDPTSTPKIKAHYQDKDHARSVLLQKLKPISAKFLRRHKLSLHEKTYVSRSSDEMIRQRCAAFRPSNLNSTKTKKKNNGVAISIHRAPENQIVLLRDVSGAGKTTLAVQLALNHLDGTIVICRTASDPSIDNIFEELGSLGSDYGLEYLKTIDGTILYVIDSLDEAEYLPGSRKAVISLNKTLDNLNKYASDHGLARFPIIFIYTLRDEHWRFWESVFEGADVQHHMNRFSFFDNTELKHAIQSYSSAYGYSFVRTLTKEEVEAIRSPFDLFVFSETFYHEGEIDPNAIFSQSVLSNYFRRKEENIGLRPIPGVSAERVIGLMGLLATRLTSSGSLSFDKHDAFSIFRNEYDIASENYERIINTCLSENILTRSDGSSDRIRFRHNRFIEYLVALHFAGLLRGNDSHVVIESLIDTSNSNSLLNVVSICDVFRQVCKDRHKERFDEISSHFSQSVPLLKRIAEKNRVNNAHGLISAHDDLQMLNRGLSTGDPELVWEIFFVLMAKLNLPTLDTVTKIFLQCWQLNSHRKDSWKIVQKLNTTESLISEEVVKSVLSSRRADVWFTYFDRIVSNHALKEFAEVCHGIDFVATAEKLAESAPRSEWNRVVWILRFLSEGQAYPLGTGEI